MWRDKLFKRDPWETGSSMSTRKGGKLLYCNWSTDSLPSCTTLYSWGHERNAEIQSFHTAGFCAGRPELILRTIGWFRGGGIAKAASTVLANLTLEMGCWTTGKKCVLLSSHCCKHNTWGLMQKSYSLSTVEFEPDIIALIKQVTSLDKCISSTVMFNHKEAPNSGLNQ